MSELDQVVDDPVKLKEYLDGKQGVDTNMAVIPQNPFLFPKMPDASTYTMDSNYITPKKEADEPSLIKADDEHKHAGFWRSAWEQMRETSSVANVVEALAFKVGEPDQPSDLGLGLVGRGINYAFSKFMDTPDNWNPKLDLPKYVGVKDENLGFLLTSSSPQDMAYRYNHIMSQQKSQELLENGSTLGRLLGFGAGITPFLSPETLIPMVASAKYAKIAPTFFKAIQKSFPGMLAMSAVHEGATEMNKTSGNLVNFLENTFIDAAFGSTLYGVFKGAGVVIENSNLNQLKNFAKAHIADNIEFGFKVNEKAEIVGIDAIDSTGSVGAKAMSLYQEMANSAFYKGGLFKVPYLGTGAYAVLTGNLPGIKYFTGSPLPRLVASSYRAANEFADRVFDHFITTENTVSGGVKPESYIAKMRETRRAVTALGVQLKGAYVERLGYKTWPTRSLQGIQNLGLQTQQKAFEVLAKESASSDFVSWDGFMDEIQRVLYTGEANSNSTVNEIAQQFRTTIDDTYKAFKASNPQGPISWLGPKQFQDYLFRVYDTPYLSTGAGKFEWEKEITKELRNQDQAILERTQPIRDTADQIATAQEAHSALLKEVNIPQPSEADLVKEEKLRDATRPIKARLSKAKSALNKAKKEPTRIKNRQKIDEIQAELKPHQDALDEHLGNIYGDDIRVKQSSDRVEALKMQKRAMEDQLSNDLRENPDWHYHVDDHTALSANESEQLKAILKPVRDLESQLEEQKAVVNAIKSKISRSEQAAKKGKTVETGKKHAEMAEQHRATLDPEEIKLREVQDKLDQARFDLQDQAHNQQIDRRFYRKNLESGQYEFQDPSNRLKFRDVYESDVERLAHAKAYYSSILNMHPEDIISDMMGKLSGNKSENALKSRTLMVPDKVLYDNNFMTKDLMAKTANYVNYLGRMTHFSNAFKGVSYEDGFQAIAKGLLEEHQVKRGVFDKKIAALTKEKEAAAGNKKELKRIDGLIADNEKAIRSEVRKFEEAKDDMKYVYENRLMGYNKRDNYASWQKSLYMNAVSIRNLHNLAFTMITDTTSIGAMHGIWGSVRDGLFPMMQSMFGTVKTKASEAFREVAPHLHLAMQDVIGGNTERNFGGNAVPYLNMGRVVDGINKVGQITANLNLAPYVENMNQRAAASTIQSKFMQHLHEYVNGTLSEKNSLYLRKYGIDPAKWAKRMVDTYEKSGGTKGKLGGYNSKFWKWQDLEASNEFGSAVARGVDNTVVNRGLGDSPFWADDPIGMFFHTFSGWGYAFTNRFVIPKMQHPDAKAVLEAIWMMGGGALVDPLRRVSRGEDAWPEDMNKSQYMVEAFINSGLFSNVTTFAELANLLSGDRLLGDLRNDKYRNRMRVGFGSVGESTFSALGDVVSMAASGEVNQSDLKKAASFMPFLYAPYMRNLTNKYIENTSFPRTREQARKLREFE